MTDINKIQKKTCGYQYCYPQPPSIETHGEFIENESG